MKSIVLYSTRTGNTKKVAEAIVGALPKGTPCVNVKEIPSDIDSYDCVFMGFWVDKGTADALSQEVIKKLHNPHVALFATLGADPDSNHAKDCLRKASDLLPEGIFPVDMFICQGAVDPKVIEMMFKMFPEGHPHGKSPQSEALLARAAKHPDDADFRQATEFAKSVWEKVHKEG